jgi:ubiquinone/menaquinone biosynthesis C-methylase UbiE
MSTTVYDRHVQFYVDFVDQALAEDGGLWHVLMARFREILGERLVGAHVCDIACGEGYLSRFLGALGPKSVVGVDISAALIDVANQRRNAPHLSFRVDDAQQLRTFPDASIDIAVSQLAIMDIPDHRAMFHAVRRVLKSGGMCLFSLLHPCFEAPFHLPDEPQFIYDESNRPIAYRIHRYRTEGYWQSGGTGVRGQMGAYHRTLSTLINDLFSAGFLLERLEEPVVEGSGLFSRVPRVLLVAARIS